MGTVVPPLLLQINPKATNKLRKLFMFGNKDELQFAWKCLDNEKVAQIVSGCASKPDFACLNFNKQFLLKLRGALPHTRAWVRVRLTSKLGLQVRSDQANEIRRRCKRWSMQRGRIIKTETKQEIPTWERKWMVRGGVTTSACGGGGGGGSL